ncbi:MAG: hypothetical protein ACE5H4_14650 [Candidatus Thorarchaeota archaeon]
MTAEADLQQVVQMCLDGTVHLSEAKRRTSKWIDPETGHFIPRDIEVRGNSKNPRNTTDVVYGCPYYSFKNCPWGCYAGFGCKKLSADFTTPVEMMFNPDVLRPQLKRVAERIGWVRIGVMSEPGLAWDKVVQVCDLSHKYGVTPVVFSRLWKRPTKAQMRELVDNGAMIHATVSAFDSDDFLSPRANVCKSYLQFGGHFAWRPVSFHFDDTTSEGLRLWSRQGQLMNGELGATSERSPWVLENPARVMRGKKEYNPNWRILAEWAYFKAPTTKRHRFSAHNHNWTAGVLYDEDACWVGCRECTVQCLVPRVRKSKQSCVEEFV